jgi:glyoxylase-like metal-dependent hydrolase (beta-lactamase superfamily II)
MVNQISDGLFCLNDEPSKAGLRHYAYFLVNPAGNLLFHPLKKTRLLKRQESLFAEHGGIKLQILTHDAEASSSCDWIYQRFGSGLYVHSSDAPQVAHKTRCPIAHAFQSGHRTLAGLDAIPLTGHTLGFTAYKLTTPETVFLFTGDFLVPVGDRWIANVYKLLKAVGIANLKSLKELEFDAVLPNMSKGPRVPPFSLAGSERLKAIDEAIRALAK